MVAEQRRNAGSLRAILCLLASTAGGSPGPAPAAATPPPAFYVSPGTRDADDAGFARPFATLTRAVTAMQSSHTRLTLVEGSRYAVSAMIVLDYRTPASPWSRIRGSTRCWAPRERRLARSWRSSVLNWDSDTVNRDTIIAFNVVRDIDRSTTDSGAIYVPGRGRTDTHIVIAGNLVDGSGRAEQHSVGIYLDDPTNGVSVAGAGRRRRQRRLQAYIATHLQAKLEATTGAHKWLDDRVSELRAQFRNADEAVETYRRRTGMTSGKGGALIDEQVTSLGDQIVKAQTLQADVGARLRAAGTPGRHAFGLEQDYAAAKIISCAEPPRAPTFPKPSLILPVTFIASCIVAALLVLAVESLNNGYSSLEQVEQQLGIVAIGIFPQMKRKYLRANGRGGRTLENPTSRFGETVRNLYTSLMLSNVERPPKIALVASSLPGEGKPRPPWRWPASWPAAASAWWWSTATCTARTCTASATCRKVPA